MGILTRALLLLLLAVPSLAEEDPEGSESRGSSAHFEARPVLTLGQGIGAELRSPEAIGIDPFGAVYVADTENHRVLRFSARGEFEFEYGGYGWDEGRLSRPTDVSAQEGFRLFVVDAGNDRIQSFSIQDSADEGGVFAFRPGRGFEDEELVRPYRLDLDAEGRIYVSDELCHCVWIFTPTGELVAKLGGYGAEDARFDRPSGVAVSAKGEKVFVADAGNRRVQVFDSVGNWIATWAGAASAPLREPVGVDVGGDGRVYVADAGTASVRVFNAEGAPLFSFGGPGDGPGRFRALRDVAVGPDGRVWTVDAEREVAEAFVIERVSTPEP